VDIDEVAPMPELQYVVELDTGFLEPVARDSRREAA